MVGRQHHEASRDGAFAMKRCVRASYLLRDSAGSSAVEFALVAPVLLAFIFLLIEGGRLEWTQQALQEVASNTARCMALGTAPCADTPSIQGYAAARGLAWGVTFKAATTTVTANATCNSVSGMNKIAISLPYGGVTGLLPFAPSALTASACAPSIG
jgi:Flp pilus assembly protein TadG